MFYWSASTPRTYPHIDREGLPVPLEGKDVLVTDKLAANRLLTLRVGNTLLTVWGIAIVLLSDVIARFCSRTGRTRLQFEKIISATNPAR